MEEVVSSRSCEGKLPVLWRNRPGKEAMQVLAILLTAEVKNEADADRLLQAMGKKLEPLGVKPEAVLFLPRPPIGASRPHPN